MLSFISKKLMPITKFAEHCTLENPRTLFAIIKRGTAAQSQMALCNGNSFALLLIMHS